MFARPDSTALANIDQIKDMILQNGLQGLPLEEQLQRLADALLAAGFSMQRLNMGSGTLHPVFGALTFVWQSSTGRVQAVPQTRSVMHSDMFNRSPIKHMQEIGASELRQRLDVDTDLPFPVLEELRADGMTEYAAYIARFGQTHTDTTSLEGIFFSVATDQPAGFDEAQLADVFSLLPDFAMAVKARLVYEVAATIAETYLGADAGQRVLVGEIVRGSTRTIDAIIWFCDLRGFTALSDSLGHEDLIGVLDDYFELLAAPVEAHGGQILKFMGDGFLATFEFERGALSAVAGHALSAAQEVRASVRAANGQRRGAGRPSLDFGLALHVGEVFYGNIGTDNRLDFTVVGPAVNLASRIQDQCRPLARDILVSQAFSDALGNDSSHLEPLGSHQLRGVAKTQPLFALRDKP